MRLSMDSWKIAQPDQDVSVGAAEFSLKGDLSDALELNYAWDGFKANGRYNGHNTVEITRLWMAVHYYVTFSGSGSLLRDICALPG